jgi:acyl carrier protein
MTVTEDQLLDLISEEAIIDRAKLNREATLGDLGISSLDVITMLFELEERYGVVIEEADMPQMNTLGEMVDFLLERLNADKVAS